MATNEITINSLSSCMTYSRDEGMLRAHGKVHFVGEQRFSFPLEEIAHEPVVLNARHSYFRLGYRLAIYGALALLVLPRLAIPDSGGPLIGAALGAVVAGAILMLALWRKCESITFLNHTGSALFTVIRERKNTKDVDRLLEWITNDGQERSGD